MASGQRASTPEVMVVNDVPGEECRIAILEDNHLEELFIERTSTATDVGNIYKGRVVNVEPAIQAAFIDYGEGANGFLHISDLHPRYFPGAERTERVGKKIPRRDRPPIQEALKRGKEVLVQVLKEGIGTKGPTLTSYLSIPGRLLVMMPDMDRVGVSRKVEDEEKRRKMRDILDSLDLPDGFGFILRTAGFGQTKTELKRDAAYLQRLWKVIDQRIRKVPAPCELYAESDLLIRTVRDVLRPSIEAIIVDSESAYERVSTFLQVIAPRSAPKVLHYRRSSPIFHTFDIERQIDLIHQRVVPLPSGGELVIDQTEAMVAIDVNSGKSRGARDSESNAYHTNCEAVDELCRQLRLRDLGGLVVNDLIDMRQQKHRRQIEERVRNNLKRDRAKSTILHISEFGLLEMTRQRMRPSMRKSHFMPCPHCDGHGEIKSPESMASEIARHVGYLIGHERVRRVEIACSPRVASVILSKKRRQLVQFEEKMGKKIDFRVSDAFALDRVDYFAYDDRNADIALDKLPVPNVPTVKEIEREHEQPESVPAEIPEGDVQPRKRSRRRRRKRKDDAEAQAPEVATLEGATESIRVHVLAKDLGVTSKDVLEVCEPINEIDVSTHMSSVTPEHADIIRNAIAEVAGDGEPQPPKKKRRRRRGGRGRRKSQITQPQDESKPAPEAQVKDVDEHADADSTTRKTKRTRRGKRGGRKSRSKESPAPEVDGQDTSAESTSETTQVEVKSKKKRRSRRKSSSDASSTADESTKAASTSVNGASDAQSSETPVKKKRRTLYRNRKDVSSTAREAAEMADA